MTDLPMKRVPLRSPAYVAIVAAAMCAVLLPVAALASTAPSGVSDDTREFKQVMQRRGDTAVPVKFVMSVSGGGAEQQQEGQTQGTLVSADGLILVPGRVVSLDLRAFTRGDANGGLGGGAPSAKSGQFRVRLAGSDEWLPADLVTRDTELGIAWLRLRHPPGKLPYVDFADAAKVVVGTQLFTVMRTSDQFGSVPIVRAGYILGETTVPRPTFLIDGSPGVAFDGEGKPAGYVDVDLAAMIRSRSSSGSIGMDMGDSVFSMIPADRIGRITKQASVLPVVKPTDSDDVEPPPTHLPARKHGDATPTVPDPNGPHSGRPAPPAPPVPGDDQTPPDPVSPPPEQPKK